MLERLPFSRHRYKVLFLGRKLLIQRYPLRSSYFSWKSRVLDTRFINRYVIQTLIFSFSVLKFMESSLDAILYRWPLTLCVEHCDWYALAKLANHSHRRTKTIRTYARAWILATSDDINTVAWPSVPPPPMVYWSVDIVKKSVKG